MVPERLRQAVDPILAWAERRPDLLAVALVGSWARGEARTDSDIDLVLLTDNPDALRQETSWHLDIAWGDAGLRPDEWRDVDYGAVWSRHVLLSPLMEVELSFAEPSWAALDPIDAGTRAVVANGFQILLDKTGLLARLQRSLQGVKR
jgi:predicted nucleotidyltransferase